MATPTRVAEPPVQSEDCIPFPLKAITDNFPTELKPALRKQPSEHVLVQIPRSVIQPQLATGAVRITFAQLRAATPDIFFNSSDVSSDIKLSLPLEAVLQRMMPSRREDQRQPAIPVNIPSVFAKTGVEAARPPGAPVRGGAEPWYSQRRPSYEAAPAGKAADPTAGIPNGATTTPAQHAREVTEPVTAQSKPGQPILTTPAPSPAATPALAAPLPVANAEPPPKTVSIPVAVVLTALTAELREALATSKPEVEAFAIPMTEIETRMRAGKLKFKWNELAGWCGGSVPESADGDMDVVLPLVSVVPLFLAARQAPDARKKIEVDSRIPDVFGKSTVPAAPEPEPSLAQQPVEALKEVAVSDPTPVAPATPTPAIPIPVSAPFPTPVLPPVAAPEPVAIPFPKSESAPLVGPVPTAADVEANSDNGEAKAAPLSFRLEKNTSTPISAPPPVAIPVDSTGPSTFRIKATAPSPAPAPPPGATPALVQAASPPPAEAEPTPLPPPPEPLPATKESAIPPAAVTAPAPVASIPEPIPMPLPAPAPEPVAPAPTPNLTGPAFILQRIRGLDGVVGAFLATGDGLLIAGDVPDANEKVLAAFAPTVFSQLGKYSEMAKLGSPEAIDLHLGIATMHVRKTGKVFLGVLLPNGHPVPLQELDRIAPALQPHIS